MKTLNYEMFVFEETNRTINKGLVSRLMKSIQEIGYVESRPVIVNESMVIIDGQHRFHACKNLNLPIFYEISNIDKNKAMIHLNMNQQIWRLDDYIHSHANRGVNCYIELINFENKYKLGSTNTILCCANNFSAKKIREGKEFIINNNCHNVANFILRCKPFLSFFANKNFVASINILYSKLSNSDCEKVFDKIQSLRQQATTSDYLVFFENILNRNKRSDSKIVLRNN